MQSSELPPYAPAGVVPPASTVERERRYLQELFGQCFLEKFTV